MTHARTNAEGKAATTGWPTEIATWLLLIFLVFGFHSAIAKPFYIPSESMMPTLQAGDHLVVSKYPYGWSYASASFHVLPFMKGRLLARSPERGDIVIAAWKNADGEKVDLIKRAIGLPGDRVQMIDGRLWLNGSPVAKRFLGQRLLRMDGNLQCDANFQVAGGKGEAYCRLPVYRETLPGGRSYEILDLGGSPSDNTAPYTVPAGHLFLLGDNRDNSADSRVPGELGGLGGAVPLESIGGRAEFSTFSSKGEAGWNPLSWLSNFREDRSWTSLRPEVNDARR